MKEEHKKIWGKEIWMVNTNLYCGKILYITPGKMSSIHHHKNKDETFYVLKGRIFIEVDGVKKVFEEGGSLRIIPNIKHRFGGLGEENIMVEISTHHEDEDSYRETQSGDITKEMMEDFNQWQKKAN